MKKILRVIVLGVSIILLSMQNVVEAKYVFSYENEIIEAQIDKKAPVVEGAEENGKYNQDVTITYYDNSGIKEAIYYYNSEAEEFDINAKRLENGTTLSEEGYYKIVVTDRYDNATTIETFLIDKTAPEITGMEETMYDLPPNIEYYDKYGIEKVEIKSPEELDITHDVRVSNRNMLSDRTGSTVTAKISCMPQNVIEYKWYIKRKTEKQFTFVESNLEENYTFQNLQPATDYNVYCIAITGEGKAYMSNIITAGTLEVEKIEISQITKTGYTIKVTGIPEKYSSIYFPTWTEKNGQDDVIWYEEKITNHQCVFELNYKKHNSETGLYRTHIYAKENNTKVLIQTAKVWIQENEPESEIVKPAGKTEITVTDTAGNVSKEEYYTDKIVTIDYSSIKRKR